MKKQRQLFFAGMQTEEDKKTPAFCPFKKPAEPFGREKALVEYQKKREKLHCILEEKRAERIFVEPVTQEQMCREPEKYRRRNGSREFCPQSYPSQDLFLFFRDRETGELRYHWHQPGLLCEICDRKVDDRPVSSLQTVADDLIPDQISWCHSGILDYISSFVKDFDPGDWD